MKYDVLVIGGGPAGMTAALYCVREGLKTGIISKDIGGTANSILRIENWPGFSGSGGELMKKFYGHIKEYEIDFIMKEVKSIDKDKDSFNILAGDKNLTKENKELKSKSVIIATGTKRNNLGVAGEKELQGKGVSHCVTCDAFFYKDKKVAVVGGSDCAAKSALALSDVSKEVSIFYKGEKLDCEDITHKKLEKRKNVKIFYNSLPIEIMGEKNVEGLKVQIPLKESKKREERIFEVKGVFIEVGSEPVTEFIKNLDLKLDKDKHIKVNKNMETSVKGVYAAGDVIDYGLKQVVVATGQGAIAGKNSSDYLKDTRKEQ